MSVSEEIARTKRAIRDYRNEVRKARWILALLWLPTKLGFRWAKQAVEFREDVIKECAYATGDLGQSLWRLETRGSLLALFTLGDGSFQEDSGYDGWLPSCDQYL